MAEEPQSTDTMIAALLREREGYLGRGMTDRAAQVDEQLKLRGYAEPAKQPAAAKKTAPAKKAAAAEQRTEPPQGRTQQAPEQT